MHKKKIVLIVLAFLLAGLAAGLYYVNATLLPTIVREKITTGLATFTGGQVTMEKVSFDLLRGIVVSNLTLYEKDNPRNALCSVKEASASFLILPFFKQKQIVVPSLKLKSATLRVIRQKDKNFNLSYLWDKFKQAPPAKAGPGKPPAFFIKSIEISDASVLFTDASFETPVSVTLKLLRLTYKMSWNRMVLETSAEISKDRKITSLHVAALYSLTHQSLKADLWVKNLDLKLYSPYLQGLPAALDKGELAELKATCVMEGQNIKADAAFRFDHLSLHKEGAALKEAALDGTLSALSPRDDFKKCGYQGRLNVKEALLSLAAPVAAQGSIERSAVDFTGTLQDLKLNMDLNGSGISVQKDNFKLTKGSAAGKLSVNMPRLSYEGTVAVKSADIAGLPSIDTATQIISTLKIKNTDITLEKTTAKILETPVTLSGSLKNNILSLDAAGAFDLTKLLPLLGKETRLPALELSGMTDLSIHYVCDLSKKETPAVSGEASLTKVTLALNDPKTTFSADKGLFRFDTQNENIRWHFDSVIYNGAAYGFDGSLKGFKTPLIHASIIGEDIKILTEFTKREEVLDFASLKGHLRRSAFDVTGSVRLKNDLDLSGTVILDLGDLKNILPQNRKTLEKMGLAGQSVIRADITGPTNNYKLWNIKANASSRLVILYGLRINNVALDYTQINQEGFINNMTFGAYQGKGQVKGRLQFLKNNIGYSLQGILQDIDLDRLKLDTGLRDKTFYGILGLNISVRGNAAEPKSADGQGNLVIKNGNLWEFNPLKGLGNFLFIPRFTNIVFTNAQGDFAIKDGFVATDNFELLGTELGLIAEGRMSFSGDLDFLVNTQVIPAGPLGKVTEAVTKAGSLTAIKITGTVQEPKYKLQAIGENIMKKLGDLLSNIAP